MYATKPVKSAGRPLRRDAQRNREAIVAAAAAAFAREGIGTPLEPIAKAAGVAIGTLYSHFPTRLDLAESVFADKIDTWLEAAQEAAAAEDPWSGFAEYLETVCQLQADDRGLGDLTSMSTPLAECVESRLAQIRTLGQTIVQRAQSQGTLRADVSPDDMAFVIWAHGGIMAAIQDVAPEAWRRHLALMLDGFRAERATPLPVPPLHVVARAAMDSAQDDSKNGTLCKVFAAE
ncbi:TetR/AcrR family transcriptional regulator [Streptomyces sp. NPDC016675]|uniref:TetR/AcrR family transcriptional regulator n=1 Tax=Streptomyces sp. NPDC016675 TaxID=3364970 RepID=UPI0036FCFBF7